VSGEQPRVAVLMPVHADQAGLERSLAALAADGGRFAVVVVDDGSTPPLRLPGGLPFPARLLRLEPNRGIVGALNAGLAEIAGRGFAYVARLDASDLSLPGRIAAQAAFLDAHPDHAAVGCAATFVDLAGRPLFVFRPPTSDAGLRRFQRYRIGFIHPALMLRLAALAECGGYDEHFSGAEDYELVLRLGRRWKLANLAEAYVKVEVNPRSLSARRLRQGLVRLRVQARYFEPRDPHAWLGIARNMLLLSVTRGFVLGLKRWLERWGGGARLTGY
jgi:glycosyltransferase involved in cell wall biosynthesis